MADPDGLAGMPGCFGRAYQIGYDCETEEELHKAIWGNRWV